MNNFPFSANTFSLSSVLLAFPFIIGQKVYLYIFVSGFFFLKGRFDQLTNNISKCLQSLQTFSNQTPDEMSNTSGCCIIIVVILFLVSNPKAITIAIGGCIPNTVYILFMYVYYHLPKCVLIKC